MQPSSDWPRDRLQAHFRESAEVLRQVAEECAGGILAAAQMMAETFRAGGKVLLCGNGGSAADCQHTAAELVSRPTSGFEPPGLAALAPTTPAAVLKGFRND